MIEKHVCFVKNQFLIIDIDKICIKERTQTNDSGQYDHPKRNPQWSLAVACFDCFLFPGLRRFSGLLFTHFTRLDAQIKVC
jgi:hypothetical protein